MKLLFSFGHKPNLSHTIRIFYCIIQYEKLTCNVIASSVLLSTLSSYLQVDVLLDTSLSKDLIAHFEKQSVPTELLSSFSTVGPIQLRWGEVVPIWYIQHSLKGKGTFYETFDFCGNVFKRRAWIFVSIILPSLSSICRLYRDRQQPVNWTKCPTLMTDG